ncbi:MAG: SHD1 domain-containing protein, partial [Patescibacteria group bacterium]|nr:SHD1 domain-containing protein [Patescibacteria group bacterium]
MDGLRFLRETPDNLRRRTAWALAAFLCVATAVFAEPRTWTSADGRFSIEAELIEVGGSSVRLRRVGGAEITVPLQSLSEADRGFLAGLKRDQPPAADPV